MWLDPVWLPVMSNGVPAREKSNFCIGSQRKSCLKLPFFYTGHGKFILFKEEMSAEFNDVESKDFDVIEKPVSTWERPPAETTRRQLFQDQLSVMWMSTFHVLFKTTDFVFWKSGIYSFRITRTFVGGCPVCLFLPYGWDKVYGNKEKKKKGRGRVTVIC